MKKSFDRQVEKTELVRLDRATRLLCEDVAKLRGCSWGDVVRQFVAEGLRGGFEIERMAQGLEAVPEALKDVVSKTETLTKAGKSVADNIPYLSKLQLLEELKTLPAAIQAMERAQEKDREETQRTFSAIRGTLAEYSNMNKLSHMAIGVFVGLFVFAALYVLILR